MSDNSPAALSAVATAHDGALVTPGFHNLASFEFMQREAKLFAISTMIPAAYQAVVSKGYGANQKWEQNPAALSNCMVALDLAHRMSASPLQVMQNLHVIEGRPSWSSPFIIAMINNSGMYAHNLRFRFEQLGEITTFCTTYEWVNNVKTAVKTPYTVVNARCVAWTKDKATGDILESPPVTIELAVQEGWYTRNGSKWPTMPQVMLQYRAAAFFGRSYNPELLMGLPSADEIHDIIDVQQQPDGTYAAPPTPPAGVASEAAATAADTKVRAPRAKTPAAKAADATDATDVKDIAPIASDAVEATPGIDAGPGEVSDAVADSEPAAATQQELPVQGSLVDEPIEPTKNEASTPPPVAGKLLTNAKVDFVVGQLELHKISLEQLQEKFDVQPRTMTDKQFPDFLKWIKEVEK
jgi:hypothetical protein